MNEGKRDLGKRARDKVTGFEGIITGEAVYLSGHKSYEITLDSLVDGKIVENQVNENRVEIIQSNKEEI